MDSLIFTILVSSLHYSGAYVVEKAQNLSHDCTQEFKNAGECHSRDLLEDKIFWKGLNNTCCRQYPGTSLHCQQIISDNDLNIFLACLPKTVVSRGYFGVLGRTASGGPDFTRHPCSARSFQPVDRASDDLGISACSYPKTNCNGRGQRRFCLGGPTGDDLCMCEDGYRPHPDNEQCRQGNFWDQECTCVQEPCPPRKGRNILHIDGVICGVQRKELDYSCFPRIDAHRDLEPKRDITPSSRLHRTTTQSSSNTTQDGGQPSSSQGISFRVATGVLAAALAVTVAAVPCYIYRKRILDFFQIVSVWICERIWQPSAGAVSAGVGANADKEITEITLLNSNSAAS